MPLKIRLARAGAKKRPFYRIVIADSRAPRDGRFIEIVGTYNPILPKGDENRVMLKTERIQHWQSVGAQPTDRVLRFLDAAGLAKRPPRNNPKKALPGKKAQQRAEAAAKAAEAAAEATAAETSAEETPATATEAPAEEAPAVEAPAADDKPAEEAPAA